MSAGLVVLALILLYVPPVQDYVVSKVLDQVKQSSGMDISAESLRLRFPLDVEADNLRIIEAGGDTMAAAAKVRLSVAVTPLLRGHIALRELSLTGGAYNMGTRDSVLCLRARIDTVLFGRTEANMKLTHLDLSRAELRGGDLRMWMLDSVTPEKPDTAPMMPLTINAGVIELHRIRFVMQMENVIDSLGADIPVVRLRDGVVDLGHQQIYARSLRADSLTAAYITPASVKETSATATDTVPPSLSAPWTINADTVSLTARNALYATAGVVPLPGLDPAWIEVNDVAIEVDSFYNRGTAVTVPLATLRARERCGLTMDAQGLFAMDSIRMRVEDFTIRTLQSRLHFDATIPTDLTTAPDTARINARAEGEIALGDIALAFPALTPLVRDIPPQRSLRLNLLADGSLKQVNLKRLRAEIPGMLHLTADGSVSGLSDPERLSGDIALAGALLDPDLPRPALVMAGLDKTVAIPPFSINGDVSVRPGIYSGRLSVTARDGNLAAAGNFRQTATAYKATLEAKDFPVDAFLPSLGISHLTATAGAEGHGFNFVNPRTLAKVHLELGSMFYNGEHLSNIRLDAMLDNGSAQGTLISSNTSLDMDADFEARLSPHGYEWDLTGDIRNLDLQALRLSPTPLGGSLMVSTAGSMSADMSDIDAHLTLSDLDWRMGSRYLSADSVTATINASDSTLLAGLHTGDLNLDAGALCGLKPLLDRISALPTLIDTLVTAKTVDIRRLQAALPPIEIRLAGGNRNLVARYLQQDGITWRNLSAGFRNDSLMSFRSSLTGFNIGTTALDSLTFDANQHGKYLVFTGMLNQRPGTMDPFAHVTVNGFVADDKLSMFIRQRNIKGDEGYRLGFNASLTDSTLTLRFVPHKPTIGYKPWTINPDNYVTLNFNERMIDADVTLQGNGSRLRLYTLRDSVPTGTPADSIGGGVLRNEQIALQLDSIHLQDWLSINPFAPPIKGDVSADLRFRLTADAITGKGYLNVTDMYYGRDRVGTFGLDLDVRNNSRGVLHADVDLTVDSVKVITVSGSLNDSTARNPFLLDFEMIRFPLAVANPFLPKEYARLSGTLSGRMDVTGTMTEPMFNGALQFDSATVKIGMLGSTFSFSPEPLRVDSNIVTLDGMYIRGLNSNPLDISGSVDMHKLANPKINLRMHAADMQIVNSNRARGGAQVYGKAFINFNADVRGNMQLLDINARMALLSGSNVTYVLTTSTSALTNRSAGDMVQFVVFSDTTQVAVADSTLNNSMNINVEAELTVQPGTTINVDLSTDGQNKVEIEGNGTLNYSLNPMNDGRLTGRFNINGGFARYTPPLMSQKKFDFVDGSFVAFNGDMMNPILNIHTVDHLRANVTAQGQNSRLVTFDVGLNITNTLDNMNVSFDLSTDDDITVSNELQSMSPEQRANQAMYLLLYNTYTGPGTKASTNLNGNPLFSFLEGRLNSWAAQNIRGVDISFGIDQYDKTTDGSTSTTTSYSYRVSKSLFNDRVKIIVGGNYSTDADADENFSQNLINDISLEYMLNRAGSMYVRVFRHQGYESILEGEITTTGVGFVLRRKLNTLRNLFRFYNRPPGAVPVPASAPVDSTAKPIKP